MAATRTSLNLILHALGMNQSTQSSSDVAPSQLKQPAFDAPQVNLLASDAAPHVNLPENVSIPWSS